MQLKVRHEWESGRNVHLVARQDRYGWSPDVVSIDSVYEGAYL